MLYFDLLLLFKLQRLMIEKSLRNLKNVQIVVALLFLIPAEKNNGE